ncbi:DsrE family protein [Lacisediminimonas profundi]|uniref:DsrE family protein n=1 Tax=Lacisediminimonas profundi TaxID=2603856 RepID=UPI00124BA45D|nr:DsrE family protein [Lacisediminimonas profundi]
MQRHIFSLIAAILLAASAAIVPAAVRAEPVKVVYHMQDGVDQASRGLANIRNHLRAEPDTRIVVVALADGIQFLLKGATQRNGRPFDAQVSDLAQQGVEFRVCNFTLAAHDVPHERLLREAKLVKSGVAEIARLQAKEGFAYIRP